MFRKKAEFGGVIANKLETELELLRRHVLMLKIVAANEPVGIIRLTELSKNPQHKVRYSLRMLEQEGLIEPTVEGAVTTEKVKNFINHIKDALDKLEYSAKELKKMLEEIKVVKS